MLLGTVVICSHKYMSTEHISTYINMTKLSWLQMFPCEVSFGKTLNPKMLLVELGV